MIHKLTNMGNKYPVHKPNQINQNTFNNASVAQSVEQLPCKQKREGATPSTGPNKYKHNQLNDIYRRDAHTSSSSRVDSYNKRYITTKQQVINNQPSGVGKANNRAKWSDNHPGILSQVVKLGNNYPSTTSKKLST